MKTSIKQHSCFKKDLKYPTINIFFIIYHTMVNSKAAKSFRLKVES